MDINATLRTIENIGSMTEQLLPSFKDMTYTLRKGYLSYKQNRDTNAIISALDECEKWLNSSTVDDLCRLIARQETAINDICSAYDGEEKTMYRNAFLSPLEFIETVRAIRNNVYGSNGRIDMGFVERWLGYVDEYLDIAESVPDLAKQFNRDIWNQMQV